MIVMPSEYNREVFGGEMADTCEFGNIGQADETSNGTSAAAEN